MAYHLFAGYTYYPQGGIDDYCGVYQSLEDAQAQFDKLRQLNGELTWVQIVIFDDCGIKESWERSYRFDRWEHYNRDDE